MEVKWEIPGRNSSVACWAKRSEGVKWLQEFCWRCIRWPFERANLVSFGFRGRSKGNKEEVESRKLGACAQYSFRKIDLKGRGPKGDRGTWDSSQTKNRFSPSLPSSFLPSCLPPSLPLSLPFFFLFPSPSFFPFLTSFFLLFLLLFS